MNKKLYLFLFFTVYACGYIYSQSKPKANYNYLLYLPKDYSAQTKKYHLIIYLHGGSHKGSDLNKLKGYGLPYLVDQGNDFDFIIVSPQCPENKYWSSENWFEPLYTKIVSEYFPISIFSNCLNLRKK